jgi:predicted esterase
VTAKQIDLVFLHGFDSRPGAMLPLVESLSPSFPELDKRLLTGPVRLVDDNTVSFAWWAEEHGHEDVDTAVEWLRNKLNRPSVLVGFSQGGALGLAAAARQVPTVVGVVAMSAFMPDGFDISEFEGPLLLLHGEDDEVVDAFHAERLHRQATKAGLDCDLVINVGGHNIPVDSSSLQRWLHALISQSPAL